MLYQTLLQKRCASSPPFFSRFPLYFIQKGWKWMGTKTNLAYNQRFKDSPKGSKEKLILRQKKKKRARCKSHALSPHRYPRSLRQAEWKFGRNNKNLPASSVDRRQFLQLEARWKTLVEIYKIHANLNIFLISKFQSNILDILWKFSRFRSKKPFFSEKMHLGICTRRAGNRNEGMQLWTERY